MHMPRKQWYTYSRERTGRMRTAIREFVYYTGIVNTQRNVKRFVSVQFEVQVQRYWSAWPAMHGEVPENLEAKTEWEFAEPDDFMQMVEFERNVP